MKGKKQEINAGAQILTILVDAFLVYKVYLKASALSVGQIDSVRLSNKMVFSQTVISGVIYLFLVRTHKFLQKCENNNIQRSLYIKTKQKQLNFDYFTFSDNYLRQLLPQRLRTQKLRCFFHWKQRRTGHVNKSCDQKIT